MASVTSATRSTSIWRMFSTEDSLLRTAMRSARRINFSSPTRPSTLGNQPDHAYSGARNSEESIEYPLSSHRHALGKPRNTWLPTSPDMANAVRKLIGKGLSLAQPAESVIGFPSWCNEQILLETAGMEPRMRPIRLALNMAWTRIRPLAVTTLTDQRLR